MTLSNLFQVLIGILTIDHSDYEESELIEFQVLIGILTIRAWSSCGFEITEFQVLIGILTMINYFFDLLF